MAVDLSDAIVVHVPAISHKIDVSEAGNFGPDNVCDRSCKNFPYIVTYSFVSPMKAFEGISGRYKLSQMSLKQHKDCDSDCIAGNLFCLFVYDDAPKVNTLTK